MYIKIPFQIVNGMVEQETDVKKSVDRFIDLLIATPMGHFKADPDFGFVFKNFRFENFDEKKRTVACMKVDEPMNDFKITGTSKNPKNFAYAFLCLAEKPLLNLSFTRLNLWINKPLRFVIVCRL